MISITRLFADVESKIWLILLFKSYSVEKLDCCNTFIFAKVEPSQERGGTSLVLVSLTIDVMLTDINNSSSTVHVNVRFGGVNFFIVVGCSCK
jgi:hypothetical protein